MNLKYVIFGGVQPVIFSPGIPHDRFEDLGPITSAGFVQFLIGEEFIAIGVSKPKIKVETFGESVKLRMKPAADDAKLIERYVNAKG